jgi:hypothetical protein
MVPTGHFACLGSRRFTMKMGTVRWLALAGCVVSATSAVGQILSSVGVLAAVSGRDNACFGQSVALSPRAAAVGSMNDHAVQVFPRLPGGAFGAPIVGRAVAMQGSTLVAGAPQIDACSGGPGPMSSGVVLVYEVGADGNAAFTQQLTHDGVDRLDSFGSALAISGDAIIVGAKYANAPAHSSGTAYVFRKIDGVWEQEAQLLANDRAQGDLAGWSVDIAGDVAVVGAPMDTTRGLFTGAVKVFERMGDAWVHTQTIESPTPTVNGYFGVSVSTDGERILVGETGTNRAYLFARSSAGWSATQRLTPTAPGGMVRGGVNPQFGAFLEISGGAAYVAAPGQSAVERYALTSDGRRLLATQRMTSSHAGAGTQFGSAIAVSGREVLVGARLAAGDGLAVVMRETPTPPGSSSGGAAGGAPGATTR